MTPEEKTFQTLHAIDFLQTYNATDDSCYFEADPITQRLIGRDPSPGEVVLWGVGVAVLHHWVSREMRENGVPKWAQTTFDLLTIGGTGYTVASNHENGVRMFGDNQPVPGCDLRS